MSFQPRTFKRAAALVLALGALAAAQAQEIPVMSVMALTGTIAFAGAPCGKGIRLAFDEANEKGVLGKAKIKLIEADYASDKGQAINLANQGINRDHVVLQLGPNATVDTLAVAPVFNDAKTPVLALSTSNAVLKTGPYAFKFQQSGEDSIPLIAKYALAKTPVRKVAIIYDRNNDGLIEFRNFFRDAFKAGGGTVVAEEAVTSSDTNFLPLVTKLVGMDIDGIYFSTYAEQSGNLMVQLRQAGLPQKVRFFGTVAVATPRLVAIGGKAAEGTVAETDFVPGINRPLNKHFEALYRERYKAEPDSWAAVGYSMGQIALRAIKDAGPNPTPQKVRDALAKVEGVPVVVGDGSWSQHDRQPQYGNVMVIVKDGKFVAAP
jgi:branched-chain amino acid transport system substrate-binding protein